MPRSCASTLFERGVQTQIIINTFSILTVSANLDVRAINYLTTHAPARIAYLSVFITSDSKKREQLTICSTEIKSWIIRAATCTIFVLYLTGFLLIGVALLSV